MKHGSKIKESISKGEKDLINLSLGKKKPKTEEDHKLLDDINKIKAKGGKIYIPYD